MTTSTSIHESKPTHQLKTTHDGYSLNFLRTVLSETLKFRTLTANWVMCGVIIIIMIGLGLLQAYSLNYTAGMMADGSAVEYGITTNIEGLKNSSYALGASGIVFGSMLIASLGVIAMGTEYSTRSIQTTLTAVPRRGIAYGAKLAVITIVTFVLGILGAALAFVFGQLIIDEKIHVDINGGVLLNWLAVSVFFIFMGWMGIGLGALLRNNAGGIVTAVAILLVAYIILALFPWDWAKTTLDYLPLSLGGTLTEYALPDDAKIGYLKALGALSLWGLIPAVLGYIRFKFNDSK